MPRSPASPGGTNRPNLVAKDLPALRTRVWFFVACGSGDPFQTELVNGFG